MQRSGTDRQISTILPLKTAAGLQAGRLRRICAAVAFLSILFIFSPIFAECAAQTSRIGVLAYKGKDEALRMWTSTARYLEASIPGSSFEIVPLLFDDIDKAVANSEIDFLIANSSIYVEMEAKHGIDRIATLRNRSPLGAYKFFGGTIFCRADRTDLAHLSDIKGRKVIAVDETSLGGWRTAWREFHSAGVNPYRDCASLTFVENHETVVTAVKEGKADVGIVRTDTLERMAEAGRIDISNFTIINQQKTQDFPFLLSTRLYPEWPIAHLKNTPEELAVKVAVALLNMPHDSPAARDSKTKGWALPLDYLPVHDLMKELRIGFYRDYGKITLAQFLTQFWYLPVLFVLALLLMSFITLHILRLNRQLLQAKKEADLARSSLEQQVEERTADLARTNSELMHEISVRRESEEKLGRAEKEQQNQLIFFQTVIDSFSEPVMVIGPDYRIKFMNQASKAVSSGETFCYAVSHGSDSACDEESCPCPLREVIKTRLPANVVHRHLDRNGAEIVVEINAAPVFDSAGEVAYVIEICRDITEKVRREKELKLEEQRLFQQQKEKTIATLAGGIAHDFNNILMSILGNAELLRLKLPLTPDEARPVDSIISSVERMADLTRQMLAYAKEGKYQMRLLPLAEAVREALALSHKGKAMATEVELHLPDDLWPIFADGSQIVQAFVNLFNNAFEEMEDRHGVLTVRGENITAKESWLCQMHHEHPSGDYIHISVSDTGPGIPKAIAARVFEPFFTTKFLGRGLGLPATLGIIQNHDGCITFISDEGKGTTFHIYLPKAADEAATSVMSAPEPAATGRRHILVVDDEHYILQLLESGLKRLGYDVTAAESGEKALEAVRGMGHRPDAVILDLQLPGISGQDVFRELRMLTPGIKVIISTGYDRGEALEELRPNVPDAFVQKPYKISMLKEKLEEVLGPTP